VRNWVESCRLMSVRAKRVKLSHSKDDYSACDTWLSTDERKNVTSSTRSRQHVSLSL